MSQPLQLRRASTSGHSTKAGKLGEVSVDTTKKTAVVHDGTTPGGFPLLTESRAQTVTGKSIDLADNTLTGTTADFNAALSDGDFATQAGEETLTNKTLPDVTITGGTISGIDPLDVADGGTGAGTAAGARANLEAAQSGVNDDITELTGLTTPLSVEQGGTGAATAEGVREAIGAIGIEGAKMTGALDEAAPVTLTAASTTYIGSANSNNVTISGTTTINSFGVVQAGTIRRVTFSAALTLTHNATSLILPNNGANITVAAGDVAEFISLGAGNWRCIAYQRTTGHPLSNTGVVTSVNGNTGVVTIEAEKLLYTISCATNGASITTAVNFTGYKTLKIVFDAIDVNTLAGGATINFAGCAITEAISNSEKVSGIGWIDLATGILTFSYSVDISTAPSSATPVSFIAHTALSAATTSLVLSVTGTIPTFTGGSVRISGLN
jgi:hypothetical protein